MQPSSSGDENGFTRNTQNMPLQWEIFGGKSYVARQTRDVAKEATFKHLIQTGLHAGRKRIPSGVLILFSEYKLYSTYSVIFKLE